MSRAIIHRFAVALAFAAVSVPAIAQQKTGPVLPPEQLADRASEKATRALELEETQRVSRAAGKRSPSSRLKLPRCAPTARG